MSKKPVILSVNERVVSYNGEATWSCGNEDC